ncbi:MAG TPA: peptidylprolyl isomerase [Candidatus Deferrimicrobium sp.]|nr:peptidylprolyl isomerase [Candidatus Deferrimicrobium sp.]
MFETLRKMIVPIIITVLVLFVAMIVLEWGFGFSRRQEYVDTSVAAVINGQQVPWEAYNRVYQSLYQNEAGQSDQELPDTKVREIQQSAFRQVLHDHLLMQEAAKYNFAVTDDEIYAFLRYYPPQELQQLPYFLTDGKFDYQKYFNAMADPQAAGFWASVEPFIRETLLKQKMQEMVVVTAHVTEQEVRDYYLSQNEKLKIGAVIVGFDRFTRDPEPLKEGELEAYFNEHRQEYPMDERAALNIALIEKKPEPSDWERSFTKAKSLYDSVLAGADFSEIARQYSDDPGSAQSGGDLGWFPRGQMVPEFDRQVFSMKEGDISQPIRSQFGWHVIKAHGVKDEMEVPRGKTEMELVHKAHASHILVKAEVGQETIDKAFRRLEEFQSAAKERGFLKAAEDLEIPIRKAAPFFKGRNIQYIGNDPNAGAFAFEAKVDAISDVWENPSAVFVVQVAERLPAGLATFEEAEQKVEKDFLVKRVTGLCRDTINAIYAEIQKGIEIKKAAEAHGETYEIFEDFNRGGFVKGLGRDPALHGAAFALKQPGQISQPVEFDQGAAVLQLLERPSLDVSDFNAVRDSLYQAVLNVKRQELYGRWFDNLVKNAQIVNNVEKTQEEGQAL